MIKFASLITEKNLSKLRAFAKKEGRKLYHVLNEAIEKYLKKGKK